MRITGSNAEGGYGNRFSNVGSAQPTGAIDAGATIDQGTTVTAPSIPGIYYVWVIADNNSYLSQTDTSNDFAVSAALTVAPLPIVTFSASSISISATTTATVTINPNGIALSAVTVGFQLPPDQIHLVGVTAVNGASASGVPGGGSFSFGILFGTDQTTPITLGTVELQGLVVGGQLKLVHQDYTDGQFNETTIDSAITVATVVGSGG